MIDSDRGNFDINGVVVRYWRANDVKIETDLMIEEVMILSFSGV